MQNRKSGLLSIHFFVLLILSFLASESASAPCANLSELFCTVLNDSYMRQGSSLALRYHNLFLLLLYRRLRNYNWSIVQFTDPFADIVFVHSIQQFSLFPDQFGITFLQSCHTVSDATASRCGEQDDCLVFQ